MKKHLTIKGFIDRFYENMVKAGKEKMTPSYLKARLTLLESYWQKFDDGHYALLGVEGASIDDYMKGDLYAKTVDNYVTVKGRIMAALKDDGPAEKTEFSASSFLKQIQLPKINLPTFSGDQLAWESFRDLFRSLVGDVPSLAPVQKLQYLRASLTGEAAVAVASIELSDKGLGGACVTL